MFKLVNYSFYYTTDIVQKTVHILWYNKKFDILAFSKIKMKKAAKIILTASFIHSLYSYFDGIIAIILPANSLKFCVCKITLPGPVSLVRNKPSPPKKIFLSPFTVSIS